MKSRMEYDYVAGKWQKGLFTINDGLPPLAIGDKIIIKYQGRRMEGKVTEVYRDGTYGIGIKNGVGMDLTAKGAVRNMNLLL